MSKKRRSFSVEFKFKVALEAAKGGKTLNLALACKRRIGECVRGAPEPDQCLRNAVPLGKRQLLEEGPGVFSKNAGQQQREQEAERADRAPENGARMAEKKSAGFS